MLQLVSQLIGPISTILDKAIPDKDLKEKLCHEIATMYEKHAQERHMAQIEVNKVEAAHKEPLSLVAGDRQSAGRAYSGCSVISSQSCLLIWLFSLWRRTLLSHWFH